MGTTEVEREVLETRARFCLVTGISPTEYDQMTLDEIDSFVRMHGKINKKG